MIGQELNFANMATFVVTQVPEKKKILLLTLHYPLSMASYFMRAFRRRDDVELYTVGPYTGQFIPWMNGMALPAKYALPPDVQIGTPGIGTLPYEMIENRLAFEPDLIITIDAGIHWAAKPVTKNGCPVVHVATDPHVLDYSLPRSYSDYFFNMQKCYSKPGDIFLPYGFDPTVHYPMDGSRFGGFGLSIDSPPVLNFDIGIVEKDYDAVLIGMPYQSRVAWVNRLRAEGIFVLFENGPIFDEYREIANNATIGLNWSSMDDMVARVFEIMGFGLVPVINRVPDLGEFFQEDVHYLGFSTLDEGVEKVKWAKNNPELAAKIAKSAKELVWELDGKHPRHSYDSRVETIMRTVGLA